MTGPGCETTTAWALPQSTSLPVEPRELLHGRRGPEAEHAAHNRNGIDRGQTRLRNVRWRRRAPPRRTPESTRQRGERATYCAARPEVPGLRVHGPSTTSMEQRSGSLLEDPPRRIQVPFFLGILGETRNTGSGGRQEEAAATMHRFEPGIDLSRGLRRVRLLARTRRRYRGSNRRSR